MNQQETIIHLESKANEYQRNNDIEFARNKKNINFILRGKNKYYHANQCALFTKNLLKFGYGIGWGGFNKISKDEILKKGICFNKYSINLGYNQFCRDLQRFSSKEEMLGFVIGYNEAINHNNKGA